MRIGSGHDTHRLVQGRRLILGGVDIPFTHGLDGHSDADVVLHSITDALLGAVGLGDIGECYPDTDPAYKNYDSSRFVIESMEKIAERGWRVANLDVTIFAEAPKLGPVKQEIRANVARLMKLPVGDVNIKAKTGENVGHLGRGEAIGCHAVLLLEKNESTGSW